VPTPAGGAKAIPAVPERAPVGRLPPIEPVRPLVIAHRGASGYRPEHTLEAYELAARMGADFIEPDLVATKDGVLVARHDRDLTDTTDITDRPEFAGRRFVEELTLDELETLRARERLPHLRGTGYDGRFGIPTFSEVLELATRLGVGVYPETKHPSHFRSIGLELEPPLLDALRDFGQPVFLQSFEDNLRDVTGHPRIRLVGTRQPFDLDDIATYADGVGPARELVDEAFVDRAHGLGLEVHPYTFRSENLFLPEHLRVGDDPAAFGDHRADSRRFYDLGVDAVFSDHADHAVAARG
jgi:glycerophosphoryl diester phosphodiesterase